MVQLKLFNSLVKILVKPSGFGEPSVWHAVIVTFIHYFSWGLLTVPSIEKLSECFGNRVLLVDGLVYGVRGILSFVATPIMGSISDIRGRKVVMLLAVVTTYSPIPLMMMKSWWYFVILALSSVFGSTYSASLAYVADCTSLADRYKGYGMISASFFAGQGFSPLFGNSLMKSFGSEVVILFATITGLLNILFIIFGVPESLVWKDKSLNLEEEGINQMLIKDDLSQRQNDEDEEVPSQEEKLSLNLQESNKNLYGESNYHIINLNYMEEQSINLIQNGKKERNLLVSKVIHTDVEEENNNDKNIKSSDLWAVLKRSLEDKTLIVIYLISFLSCWPLAGVDSIAPVYLKYVIGFEYEEVSLMLGMLSVLSITSNLLLGHITNLIGANWSIRLGLIFLMLNLLFCGFGTQHWMFWLGGVLFAIATIIPAATNSVVSIYANEDHQGVVMGIISGIESLSDGLGPAIFGVLFYIFQEDSKNAEKVIAPIPMPFVLCSCGVFVAIILTCLLRKDPCKIKHKKFKNVMIKYEEEREPLMKTSNNVKM
ncbi:hippocampus abundant transcript 1 protein [Drosophila ficusphila]|uniref:hippocampus abundant transcript 1 protein n=1 Tax=Drosophila ficusphila TaxID=30025 RepID=UPI001C89F6A2|nr:hippocampus abundant transcript 1 protein [Drosophila ficusphila]